MIFYMLCLRDTVFKDKRMINIVCILDIKTYILEVNIWYLNYMYCFYKVKDLDIDNNKRILGFKEWCLELRG